MRYTAWIALVALVLQGVAALADELPENISEIKTLTVAQAQLLSQRQYGLQLHGLRTISEEAAETLATHKGKWLSLVGLNTISDQVAESLSRYEGGLMLSGLTVLSEKAAESFAKHKGGWLNLDGLNAISDSQAEALGKHRGTWLFLNGLTTLSDRAAESLSKHRGDLSLGGLTTLSDSAALALSRHRGSSRGLKTSTSLPNTLFLNGLANISGKAAAVLGANPAIILPTKFKPQSSPSYAMRNSDYQPKRRWRLRLGAAGQRLLIRRHTMSQSGG